MLLSAHPISVILEPRGPKIARGQISTNLKTKVPRLWLEPRGFSGNTLIKITYTLDYTQEEVGVCLQRFGTMLEIASTSNKVDGLSKVQ